MRFEPDAVLEFAEGLDEPRTVGSEGERRAADRLAERLGDAGLRVERFGSQPGWLPRGTFGVLVLAFVLPWPGLPFLLWYLIGVDQLVPDHSLWLRLGVPFLMVVALGDALWSRVRATIGSDAQAGSEHLVGYKPAAGPKASRLILLTRLDTPARRWALPLEIALVLLGVAPLFKYALSPSAREFESVGVLTVDLVVPWLALLAVCHGLPVPPPRPWPGDNRTGLGTLAELARTWPDAATDRSEVWFVATPDPSDFSRALRARLEDGVPTLVLALDAPGCGPQVVVRGRGKAGALVETVARSLWLPFRVGRGAAIDGWRARKALVAGVGGESSGLIEGPILAATGQLIVETALRWGKGESSQAPADASAARSSQNPG